MIKLSDIALGAVIGATLGATITFVASTKIGREVLKAAARPAPRKTTVVVVQKKTFWDF